MTELAVALPAIGNTAPDFSLPSTSGETVTLSAFRNDKNVLLAFFPLAFTGTCTQEMCAFSEDFDQFTGKDVTVLPISVDAIPTLKEYRKSLSLKLELLSDFKRVASRLYGVLDDEQFYATRSYFLIDQSGILRWSHIEAHNGLHRANDEILMEIGKLGS